MLFRSNLSCTHALLQVGLCTLLLCFPVLEQLEKQRGGFGTSYKMRHEVGVRLWRLLPRQQQRPPPPQLYNPQYNLSESPFFQVPGAAVHTLAPSSAKVPHLLGGQWRSPPAQNHEKDCWPRLFEENFKANLKQVIFFVSCAQNCFTELGGRFRGLDIHRKKES